MSNPFLYIASFRGIPFRIDTADTTFGRRNQLHEYPQRDEPYAEDLGKKAREYNINAYVIGTGYTLFRTLLINAVEKNKTPGQLIHPVFGIKTVVPKDCRHMYSNKEDGIEYFNLTFVEAGANLFPDIINDIIGLFNIRRIDGLNSLIARFAATYSIFKAPEFVRTAASSLGVKASGAVLQTAGNGVINAEKYAEFIEKNSDYQKNIVSLTTKPAEFGEGIAGLVGSLTTIYPDPKDAYAAQKSLLDFDSIIIQVAGTTPNRRRQVSNQSEIINLVKNAAIVEMANAILQTIFSSVDDAIASREDFDAIIDAQMTAMANSSNDASYTALSDIRISVLDYINDKILRLFKVIFVQIADSVPALVFAYNQYDDAARDQEIVERNSIRNPVFLPPHSDIAALQG